MVATTQPASARIGVEVLAAGGTAADAAVAVAAVPVVAGPRSNSVFDRWHDGRAVAVSDG
jgi:gamma-glutamyltranspeptidase